MTPLIPRATPLEAALERATAARLALPAGLVGSTNDPWTCPADQLGLLAWSLSLEIWDDRWPELKKRQVCADALGLHRSKTTLAGIRAHLALVDATVVRTRRPADRTFLVPARTATERVASLASLPQLRVYPFLERSAARGRSFWRAPVPHPIVTTVDADGWDFSSSGPSFDASAGKVDVLVPRPIGLRVLGARDVLRTSRGDQLTGLRTTIVEDGVEREVARAEIAGGFRILARPSRTRSWYGAGHYGRGFRQPSTIAGDGYTLRLDPDAPAFAVQPGQPLTPVRPTRVHTGRAAPRARRFHGAGQGRFMLPSHGAFLVYDQVPLLTRESLSRRQRSRAWHGVGRLGHEPFTAELLVDVPLHRGPRRNHRFHGVGFRAAADLAPVSAALEAIRASKAARDTILVNTTVHRPVRLGDGLRFGSFRFGEIRKAA